MPICAKCQSTIEEDAAYCPYCGSRIEGVAECDDYEYEAFISYRHLPHDTEVAKAIQKHVEGFKIPKELRVDGRGKRLGRMFRDEDELPTSSSLTDQIRDALMRSRFLVVVCTPETRESRWVAREVELFSSFHGRDHVLVALAAKEPDESFPELLLHQKVVRSDGAVELEPTEPLASDFRDPKKYRIESTRIAAALLGCGYDDLHQRLRTRRLRLASSIAAGVAAVSVAFGAFSTYQQMQITENYRLLQINESALLADKANALLEEGDRYEAIQAALSALPDPAADSARPYVPSAQVALENALEIYPSMSKWVPSYSQIDVDFWNNCISDDGLMATMSEGQYLEVREVYTGNLVSRIDMQGFAGKQLSRNESLEMAFAGDKLLFAFAGTLGCFDARTGEQVWKRPAESSSASIYKIAISPDGGLMALEKDDILTTLEETSRDGQKNREITILRVADGELEKTIELPNADASQHGHAVLCFSPTGDAIAAAYETNAYRINVKSGKVEQRKLHNAWAVSVAYVGDYLTFISSEDLYDAQGNTSLDVFDADFSFLWERTADVPMMLDDHFNEYNYLVGAFGTWCYSKGDDTAGPNDDEQLVVTFGTDLLLLDTKTGAEVYKKTFESPLLGCKLLPARNGTYRIVVVAGEGDVVYRRPQEGKDQSTQSAFLDGNVGRMYRGDVFEHDGQWFVSTWKANPNKHVMYRSVDERDYIDAKLVEDLEDAAFMTNDRVYTQTESALGVYAFEHDDIEQLQVYDLTAFEQLANPERAIVCVSEMGPRKLCVAGQAKPADGSESTFSRDVVVYVLDEASDTPLAKLEVPEAGSVRSVSCEMDEATDHMQVLLQDSRLVTVVDAETGEVVQQIDRSLSAVENAASSEATKPLVRDGIIDSALFAGENIVVCQSVQVSDSNSYETFVSLVNRVSGDVLDADISRYPGAMNALTTISNDGMLFAMECQDGAIRLFDTQTGSLIWESFNVSDPNCLKLVGGGDVFYQDASRAYGLLSGKTGEVTCESTSDLPTLRSECLYYPDENELVVFCKGGHYASVGGLAVVSLDEDAFGARSIIDEGRTVSADGTAVLLRMGSSQTYLVRKPTLDELQTRAHEMLEAHGM
ncbi:MAG: TIR domain-containing protein [Coriobacteriia bacterium]|nr:TIR domain-containing protein [Coriobacteriia bacterium]